MKMKKCQLSYFFCFALILLLPLQVFAAAPVDAGAGENKTIANGDTVTSMENLVPGAYAHDGGKITIVNGAAVHTNAASSAAVAAEGGTNRDIPTITMSGNNKISTSGDASAGVKAVGFNTQILGQSLTVNTSGNESHGLVALDGGWIRTGTSNVTVATTGEGSHAAYADGAYSFIHLDVNLSSVGNNSHAAYANDGGTIYLGSNATVSTAGNGSNAVLADGANSRVSGTSGAAITTGGDNSHGFAANNGGSASLTSGTKITTKGSDSYGMTAGNGGKAEVTDNAAISTVGTGSHAVSSTGNNSLVSIGNQAKVTTTGDGAYGISAADGGMVQLGQNITVSSSGAGAHGVTVTGGSSVVAGSADIKTSGPEAHGLLASGENSGITITDDGNISVSGARSYGVWVNDGAEANIKANVSATGNYGAAVAVDDGKVTVDGNVSATGYRTYGVNASNGSEVDVTGDVTVRGRKLSTNAGPYYYPATGVRSDASDVNIYGNVYVSIDTAITPSLVSGVEAVNNGTVYVAGNIAAEGLLHFNGVTASSGGTVNVGGDINVAGVSEGSGNYPQAYYGAQADGANSSVNVDGSVSAQMVSSGGVLATNGGIVTVKQNVTNNGILSKGVQVSGGGTVDVGGNVESRGKVTSAVNAGGGTVHIGGDVKATGDSLSGDGTGGTSYYGVFAGNGIVANDIHIDGSIILSTDANASVYDETYRHNPIFSRDWIASDGYGVYLTNGSVNVGGEISALGDYLTGAFVSGDNSAVDIAQNISMTGSNSIGAHAYKDGGITVGGGIIMTGNNSIGALADDPAVINVGYISMDGYGSVGAYSSDDSVVNVTNYITVTGDDSIAAKAISGGLVDVGGNVIASGLNSIAVAADGGKVTVGGNVSAKGYNAYGVNALNGSEVDVTGDVTVQGQRHGWIGAYYYPATGVLSDASDVNIYGNVYASIDTVTSIINNTDRVSGVEAINNGTVYVAGNIEAEGRHNFRGATASSGGMVNVSGDIKVTGVIRSASWGQNAAHDYYGALADGANSSVNVDGSVLAVMVDSGGVLATNGGVVNVKQNITNDGLFSHGVEVSGGGTVNVGGNVESTGIMSRAVDARGGTVNISGDVKATGDSFSGGGAGGSPYYGVSAGSGSVSNDIRVDGSIILSTDATASQYDISYMHSATLVITDPSRTSDGYGVYLTNGSVKVGGGISAQGDYLTGAFVSGDNSAVDIAQNISMTGNNSIGAHAYKDGGITVGGGIIMTGDSSIGAKAGDDGLVDVTGSVLASGQNVMAVFADGGKVKVTNGAVGALGTGSVAAVLEQGGLISLDNVEASADSGILLTTESGGTLYAGNGSELYGKVINDNNSVIGNALNVTLDGGTVFSGTANDFGAQAVTNMTLSGLNDIWRVTDRSAIKGTLVNSGKVDFTSASGYTDVTVGDLSGGTAASPGMFVMKTDVAQWLSDTLTVTGTTAGNYKIDVRNDHSSGFGVSGLEEVPLVYTADQGGTFSLTTNGVDVGMYKYRLNRNTTDYAGWGAVWELIATDLPADAPSGAANTFSGAYLLSYAETNTLIQRLGDLRMTPSLSGLWFRVHGGKFESNSRSYVKEFDMNYGGVQLGYDRKVEIGWDGDFYAGVMFGYSKGDLDYLDDGSGGVDSKMLGIYGTFTKPNGFYLDAILKYQWMNNEFDVLDSSGIGVTGDDVSTGGFGWSVEVGQKIRFGGEGRTGWYVSPQVQLSYMRQDGGYFDANDGSYGLTVGVEPFTSLLGRLGLQIGYETENKNFYAVVSKVREFDGDVTIMGNGYPVDESFEGSWWVYGLGYTSRVSDKNSIYIDIERASGGPFTQPWRINAGWRMEF